MEGIDVLRDVQRARVPSAVARREKLVELRTQALEIVASQQLVSARATWAIVPLESDPLAGGGWLDVGGRRMQAPWLLPASGELTAVACAVATIGAAIEEHVAGLFAERRASLALALDGVSNELLWALSRRVQDRILGSAIKQGLCVAGELRAGDPGLQLQEQQTVLQLAGADNIGVSLTSTMMMNPTKSTSIVQGVGRDLPPESWSRCDHCASRLRCGLVKEKQLA
jgi:hypothetical protein